MISILVTVAFSEEEHLSISIAVGLFFGMIGGSIFSFFFSRVDSTSYLTLSCLKIYTNEKLNWSNKDLWILIRKNLVFGLIGGLFFGFFSFAIFTLYTTNLFFLTVLALPFSLLGFITFSLSIGYTNLKSLTFLHVKSSYQRFHSSSKNLHFSILQHWLLRYQMSKKDYLSLKLVDFLNTITKYNFLESDGATWRFRHRILQDYFAKQWKNQQEPTNQN